MVIHDVLVHGAEQSIEAAVARVSADEEECRALVGWREEDGATLGAPAVSGTVRREQIEGARVRAAGQGVKRASRAGRGA